jgi:hypothetical protein
MAVPLFTNNASTTLSAGISSSDLSMTAAPGGGAKFPAPLSGNYCWLSLQAPSGGAVEIVKVTARSGDTFTIAARAQQGTVAANWPAGTVLELRNTAQVLTELYALLAAGNVLSFNSRQGAVTLTSNDVTTALGYTPASLNMGNDVSVIAYGADPTGVANSSAAFASAINALPASGGSIRVPTGTYLLNTQPTWGTKSILWDISAGAHFTGAGTGEGKFPAMATVGGMQAVGPWIQSHSTLASSTYGGIGAFSAEIIQPSNYVGNSVGLYAGGMGSGASANSNVWALNTLVAANSGAGGTYTSVEVDVNVFSPSAYTKGISISGTGSYDADMALEILRTTNNWKKGLSIHNSTIGISFEDTCATAAIMLNNNKINLGNYYGSNWNEGDIWINGGHLYLRLNGVNLTLA